MRIRVFVSNDGEQTFQYTDNDGNWNDFSCLGNDYLSVEFEDLPNWKIDETGIARLHERIRELENDYKALIEARK